MRNGFRTFAKLLEEANEAAREAEHARQHREAMTPEYRASLWEGM